MIHYQIFAVLYLVAAVEDFQNAKYDVDHQISYFRGRRSVQPSCLVLLRSNSLFRSVVVVAATAGAAGVVRAGVTRANSSTSIISTEPQHSARV